MSINDLSTLDDARYGQDIDSMIESNSLVIFKIKEKYTIETEIDFQLANKYIGDFHSLLLEINVPTELLYITTILNNLNSSNDFDGKTNKVFLIDPTFVNLLTSSIPEDFKVPTIKK